MAIVSAEGLPISVSTASASPHEVTLVIQTLEDRHVEELPARLIGDMAYDSDQLDAELAEEWKIEMIAPHRSNRVRPATQDGRPMRRYRKRWKVERFFAWLGNSRRVLVRHDFHWANYLGWVQLASILMLLAHL